MALSSEPGTALRDETGERVAAAAATIVARDGAAGVTHRAVATEAGLTLGTVSYKFKTSADLFGAAFAAIYRRNVPGEAALEALFAENEDVLLDRFSLRHGGEDGRIASTELMMAAIRDPGLAPFAAQIRYLRGRSTGRFLRAVLGENWAISNLDAAILSSFARGQSNTLTALPVVERQETIRREIGDLVSRLRRRDRR